jgi:glycosyltransferase involved in cell wall biosynthesis
LVLLRCTAETLAAVAACSTVAPVPKEVFFAFRDSPQRRAALRAAHGAPERYSLFGLDEFEARGAHVRHNLEHVGRPPLWARAAGAAVNAPLYGAGGYGGDFASVLAALRRINAADVVFSTVDTVGLPLILLKRVFLVRPPLVYVSIGLPERLAQLRGRRMQRLYRNALRRARTIIAYSENEVAWVRDWLGSGGPSVEFVPFGVDTNSFRPSEREPDTDVVSVGVDPRRDFELLLAIAGRRPELSFRIVASAELARTLGRMPANVELETDIPLEAVRDRFAEARVVALPVRDNSYSGATTTLLQAMAMGKPVVVSRTAAVADGYELEDGVNCRLVDPGDESAFEQTLVETLTGAEAAAALGRRARQTVERSFSWERFTDALWQVVSRC